ncbi:hypothetical protein JST99_04875 [Candidatus Dependentiae bacterium]|nr:hypothetical protein [Candidatus Dependentiae bacterium]MCC7415250.1 hypothetical protein [Campylobacterota bacterium]
MNYAVNKYPDREAALAKYQDAATEERQLAIIKKKDALSNAIAFFEKRNPTRYTSYLIDNGNSYRKRLEEELLAEEFHNKPENRGVFYQAAKKQEEINKLPWGAKWAVERFKDFWRII